MKKLLLLFGSLFIGMSASAEGIILLSTKQDRAAWTISGCSQEPASAGANTDGDLTRIIDDDVNTYWHSSWHVSHNDYNHFFLIDRGEDADTPIYGFGYTPRQTAIQGNGYVTECDVYVLNDTTGLSTMNGENGGVQSDAHSSLLTFINGKTPAGHGSFNYTHNNASNRAESKVAFSAPANGRYILFVATRTTGDSNNDSEKGNAFANCADFCTYDGVYVPCNEVFRMKMRATANNNYYVYWNGTNPQTRYATDADAFVPERLWYLKKIGNNKVTLHTIAASDQMGMEFTTTTDDPAVLSTTPTELTPTLNVQTLHADNANCAASGFSLHISGNAYVNDAANMLGVWNDANNAATDGGSLVTFYALTDADIDGAADATDAAKASAKANKTPENIAALFDLRGKFKEMLTSAINEANQMLNSNFLNDVPGYHPLNGEVHTALTNAIEVATAMNNNAEATATELSETIAQLQQVIAAVNTPYNGPFYGIYNVVNNYTSRGYLCYVENDNNYAISSGKSGYEHPGLESDAARWAFVQVNGQMLMFNVASKKFLKPTGTGANNAWLLLDEDCAPISIAASNFGLGKVQIQSVSGNTTYHMSISNNYVGGVTGYYASDDTGVPFEFQRVGDLSDELRQEMENILITRLTSPDKVYTITSNDEDAVRGSLIALDNNDLIYTTEKGNVDLDAANPNHQWSFVTIDDELYLYNIGAKKFANAYLEKKDGEAGNGSWSWQLCDVGTPVSIKYQRLNNLANYCIMGGENSSGNDVAGMMVINGNYAPVPNWSHGTDGNGFNFNKVADVNPVDDEMIAKHHNAISDEAVAAMIINTDDYVNADIVGNYTVQAASEYASTIASADGVTDNAKLHGIYAGAAHYLNASERVMPQDGLVYTIYDLSADEYVYPDPDSKADDTLGWLYTVTDNGATFTHTFLDNAVAPEPSPESLSVEPLMFDNETASRVVTLHDGAIAIKTDASVGQVYLTKDDNNYGPYKIERSNFSATTTGIEEISSAADAAGADAIFDLQGRRVNRATRGLYIINGKKVIR